MDDLTFDFERSLDAQQQGQAAAAKAADAGQAAQPQPKNYRQTVCTYWLRGLCMKGDTCGFLHQFDPQRMPVCRTLLKFGVCKEPDCPYKHTMDEIKECNMYKLGFCIYGPACRFKHTRQQGPAPDPTRLEAAKPREVRNINIVANQANEGIATVESRPARRPRLTGPGDQPPRALPAPGGPPPPHHALGQHPAQQPRMQPGSQQLSHGAQQGGPYGGVPQRPGGFQHGGQHGGPPRPPPPMQQPPQQQQQQQYGRPLGQQQQGGQQQPQRQQFGRPHGIDASVLASVGQQHLPYGF